MAEIEADDQWSLRSTMQGAQIFTTVWTSHTCLLLVGGQQMPLVVVMIIIVVVIIIIIIIITTIT